MNAVVPIPAALPTDATGRTRHRCGVEMSMRERLRVFRLLRHLIAENANDLAAVAASVARRPIAEKLVSEVLPLAESCRWLERNAERVLAPRKHGARGRPLWLHGVKFEVQRRPFGCVLIIGPANYPLFLPAVHALHAIAGGNTVRLKPAPGTRPVAIAFARLCYDAGLNPRVLEILEDTTAAAHNAIAQGPDKVIFTGSSENGRDALAALARTNTPAIVELSGEDAVIVLADANLNLVARALRFGTQLNAGDTCMVPRRVIVVESAVDRLVARMEVIGVTGLPVESVADESDAVVRANASKFGLGCSIFSRDTTKARRMAQQIRSGFVLINDLIVPTADPRMPFGGIKASGYGTTRGAEGLLEMTYPHVVAIRRGQWRPHYDAAGTDDSELFSSYIRAAYGRRRIAAVYKFSRALVGKLHLRKR